MQWEVPGPIPALHHRLTRHEKLRGYTITKPLFVASFGGFSKGVKVADARIAYPDMRQLVNKRESLGWFHVVVV